MKQLILTPKQLLSIGFTKKVYPALKPNSENTFGSKRKITYQIECLNGYFRFNVSEQKYVWYQDIVIGNSGNSICLDIQSKPGLFSVLMAFNVKFNLDLS